jgi:quercetin dioxygenase-like cupin family protein
MLETKEYLMDYYRNMGLVVEWHSDEPGVAYEPNAHERTILYTLDGSAKLEREGRKAERLLPGVQVTIETGQVHSAVVGPDGWEFVAAFDPTEVANLEQH